jgi:hypothetical protein
MSESIPPLDPRRLGLLRRSDEVPADVRARLRQRVLSAATAIGTGAERDGEGSVAVRRPAATLGMPAVAVACLAFIAGGALGIAFAPSPPPRIVYVDRAAAPPAPAPAPAAVETIPTALGSSSPRASSAPAGRASQLSAERILLDEARTALAQGDTVRAIDRLDRHRRIFPVPLLGEERDAMWIQALVKAGRYDEARTRAAAFRRRAPDSIFSSMVESALESIP